MSAYSATEWLIALAVIVAVGAVLVQAALK